MAFNRFVSGGGSSDRVTVTVGSEEDEEEEETPTYTTGWESTYGSVDPVSTGSGEHTSTGSSSSSGNSESSGGGSLRDRIDSTLRGFTGGDVGLSDDFGSTDDSGGVRETLGRVDDTTADTADFLLDNERGSFQDAYRKAFVETPMEAVASIRKGERVDLDDEQIGQAWQDADEQFTAGVDSRLEAFGLEDNRGVQAGRWLGDALVMDFGRAVTGATTGIDTEEGDTDARTGALEVFDIGVTAATAGSGKAASTAIRNADEGASFASRVSRILGRGSDDVDDVASQADEVGGLPALFRGGDDAAGATDDAASSSRSAARSGADPFDLNAGSGPFAGVGGAAARVTDEASSFVSRARSRVSTLGDDAARVSDDAGQVSDDAGRAADDGGAFSQFIRGSDDAARGSDDAARASDDTVRATDETAQAADDVGPIRRFFGSTSGKLAGATVGGLAGIGIADELGAFDLAGGLASSWLDNEDHVELETDDGRLLVLDKIDDLNPTDEHPDGASLWSVSEDGAQQGYTVVLAVTGRTVVLLDQDGEAMRAKASAQTWGEAFRNTNPPDSFMDASEVET